MSGEGLGGRLRETFVQELEEQVQALNGDLLGLEQEPADAERIRSLFRVAHNIKGAARVAGFPAVERVCHALEAVFAAVRDESQPLSGSDFSLLFATCDALQDAAARLRAGADLDGSSLVAVLPRIESRAGIDSGVSVRPPRQSEITPATASKPAARSSADEHAGERPSTRTAKGPDARGPTPADERTAGRTSSRSEDRAAEPAHAPAAELVRVRADRLDALLSAVGELTIATGRIVERSGRSDDEARRLDNATDTVAAVVRQLRLRPFGDVCESLPRAARDVAAAGGKQVDLEITGAEVEADRVVIDALRDPLLHLVRNAVDHGIESADVRVAAGKPAEGRVHVSAEITAGRLVVTVADDGAGLDEDAIRAALRARGKPEPTSSEELAEALISGRFSTRRQATEISGRGVGLDIARAALERIGGTVDVEWKKGLGTRFILESPPSPATLRAVLVRLGAYTYAIPTSHVERLRRVGTADLKSAAGGVVLPTKTGPIRVLSLARLLGPPLEARPLEDTALLVVATAGGRRAGLVVDEVIDEDEIVMRPLAAADGAVPHAAGAAILPSGRVALVLAVPALLASGLRAAGTIAPAAAPQREKRRLHILVADDSITTRTLEQSVLESAGYRVSTAVNGEEAWQMLEREGADAVVADVEMPRMDGFALCRRVRSSERFRELPIVLVTGLESPDDRARGLEAGADAYIVKSGFDQASLLDTLQQLIGET